MIPPLLVVRADPTAPLRARHKRHRTRFRDKASSTRGADRIRDFARHPRPRAAAGTRAGGAFRLGAGATGQYRRARGDDDGPDRRRASRPVPRARAGRLRVAAGFRALVLLSRCSHALRFFFFAQARRHLDALAAYRSLLSLFSLLSSPLCCVAQLAGADAGAGAVAAAVAKTATASRNRWCRCSA
jgi:hypothetical protein